jgi:hypothetical protein
MGREHEQHEARDAGHHQRRKRRGLAHERAEGPQHRAAGAHPPAPCMRRAPLPQLCTQRRRQQRGRLHRQHEGHADEGTHELCGHARAAQTQPAREQQQPGEGDGGAREPQRAQRGPGAQRAPLPHERPHVRERQEEEGHAAHGSDRHRDAAHRIHGRHGNGRGHEEVEVAALEEHPHGEPESRREHQQAHEDGGDDRGTRRALEHLLQRMRLQRSPARGVRDQYEQHRDPGHGARADAERAPQQPQLVGEEPRPRSRHEPGQAPEGHRNAPRTHPPYRA